MLIPLSTVLGMRQQYADIESDARAGNGYNDRDPVLRATAAKILREAFSYPIDENDITITCCSLREEGPGGYRLLYRATWEPPMVEVILRNGDVETPHHLSYPQASVTTSTGMRTLVYQLAGFDTDTRRYVFAAPAAIKEKISA